MLTATSILLAIAAVYAYLVARCSATFARASSSEPLEESLPPADIIVAAKNEQDNIGRLASLAKGQTHKACRLILVDDHSADSTLALARKSLESPHIVIESGGHGKKEALKCGMQQSRAGYILLTDADCLPQPQWASLMTSAALRTGADMVMAPIIIEPLDRTSIFQRLQMAESFALITITGGTCLRGAPVMCNGGNIAYKASFLKANSEGMNAKYASGDDMFMMEAASKQKRRFAYVCHPGAAIRTGCAATLKQLMNQRARWVSKTGGYTSARILFFAFAILLGNMAMIAAPALWAASLLPWWAAAAAAASKLAADTWSVLASSRKYGEPQKASDIILLEIIYPYYVLASVMKSLIKGFKWK